MTAMPERDFRSTAMEDLCRVRISSAGGENLLELIECVKLGIERSICRTEAPLSARRRPAKALRGVRKRAWERWLVTWC